ncbi:hypothetical protein FNU79_18115 [Deinococcus detaillensis]|uniref:DUF4402 domain-containing protein n=1 Tax=Deinococcus detaillensis TaxID=2592048 RepID=A0A553UGH5_9DEIO|nr:hypothetical protein [Deinococcus detaillensis]TSA79298.1 hypothetical protein FNU79_18115 [Deinococcus detaillensis]
MSLFSTGRRLLVSFAVLGALALPAQAAQVSLGLQANATLSSVGFGAHTTVETPLNAAGTLRLRGSVEGNLNLGGVPDILLDVSLIQRYDAFYVGLGAGSGVAFDFVDHGSSFPGIVLSPIFLANVHGILGTTLSGGTTVEGVLRVGAVPRLEARVSFPLR